MSELKFVYKKGWGTDAECKGCAVTSVPRAGVLYGCVVQGHIRAGQAMIIPPKAIMAWPYVQVRVGHMINHVRMNELQHTGREWIDGPNVMRVKRFPMSSFLYIPVDGS